MSWGSGRRGGVGEIMTQRGTGFTEGETHISPPLREMTILS